MPTRCVMGPPLVCFNQNEHGNYPYLFNNYYELYLLVFLWWCVKISIPLCPRQKKIVLAHITE